jgi:hypothetical protein
MSLKHCNTSTYFGVASIKTDIHSKKIGIVVKIHRIVNKIVQMGSAM